jgi:two-component system sensor histidine kinase KdpD
MTRIEAGGVHLNLELCDIQDLISTVVNQFSTRLLNHPIQLDIPNDLPLISCDAVLIAQVITNLLDNSCKYSEEGSPIKIGVINRINEIEVYVRDTGVGLSDEDLGKVFDKFYRSAHAKNTTGTGLGLSICKGIIEAHGGHIKATNNPDRGTSIHFRLPA